jgi:hypothetical protein|nr:MAG TPA: hypothetical protein [Caudoviricetes sp.]
MIINIYNKETLEIMGRPVISSLEDFKANPKVFYPDFDVSRDLISEIEYQNPILVAGNIREMTKEELFKKGKYTLANNELIENGRIKTVILSEFEYIEDNQIKYRKEEKIEKLKEELYQLRLEREKKPFEFEVKGTKYLQYNRTIDQSNITKILFSLVLKFALSLMKQITSGKKLNLAQVMTDFMATEYENWKFYTEDNSEKYVNVSVQKFIEMSEIMRKHTTASMVTETTLSHSLENKTVEELKTFNSETEYNKLFENEIKQS